MRLAKTELVAGWSWLLVDVCLRLLSIRHGVLGATGPGTGTIVGETEVLSSGLRAAQSVERHQGTVRLKVPDKCSSMMTDLDWASLCERKSSLLLSLVLSVKGNNRLPLAAKLIEESRRNDTFKSLGRCGFIFPLDTAMRERSRT